MSKANRIGAVIFSTLFSLLLIYRFAPHVALTAIYKFYAFRAGVSEFSAELTTPENASDAARPYRLPYYKGGQGPVLVLLHGFGDSKISFLQTARYLTSQYTVILPAVPGFGETERDPALKYGAHDQAR